MAEVVARIGVKREPGYLYFLRGSDVWKTPMKRAGGPSAAGKAEKVASGNFKREEGYLYFLDGSGNVGSDSVTFMIDSTAPGIGNDLLEVGVHRGADGIDRVQFFRLDQDANSFTSFGGFLLDPGHDQILLDLTRLSIGSDAITASFAYVDGGVVGSFATFGTTANIFQGENFTRAEFAFFTPVPEPASLILLGMGLAALAAGSWKRSRRH